MDPKTAEPRSVLKTGIALFHRFPPHPRIVVKPRGLRQLKRHGAFDSSSY